MKIRDLKPGQLFAVHFPYAATAEARSAKYGYRVLELDERHPELDGYAGLAAKVQNVKTGSCAVFGFPEHENNGDMFPNWVLLEDVHV